jgi:hypothetical protein
VVACLALQVFCEPGQARDAGEIVSFKPADRSLVEIEHGGRARPPKKIEEEPLDF